MKRTRKYYFEILILNVKCQKISLHSRNPKRYENTGVSYEIKIHDFYPILLGVKLHIEHVDAFRRWHQDKGFISYPLL